MSKIIISGINGQDGSYMAEYLLENTNHTIIGGIRRTSQAILSNIEHLLNNPRFKLFTLDLCDVHSITNLIRDEKPDFFINLGASSFVKDSWEQPAYTMEVNAISLIHILEAVRQYRPNCRVYSAGSSEQWGDVKYSPQDEKHPMSPRSVYGISKCTASHICKVYRESYGLYVIHGILTNHESPRRQEHFVTRKITKGVARIKHAIDNNLIFEPIELGFLDAKRDWSHSKDFMDGVWKMLNQNPWRETEGGEQYNISNIKEYILSSNETHSIREFILLAFKEAGIEIIDVNKDRVEPVYDLEAKQINYTTKDGKPVVVVSRKFYRPAEVDLLLGDSTLVRKELGWKPKYSFVDLVREMVQHDIETFKK